MHTARREEGELSVDRFGELWADSQARDARRLGRDHRRLPHVVVVHPALHRHARLRVRVRVRPAARAVGVRAVRGRGARLRAAVPRPVARRRIDVARGAGQARRRRPRRSRLLGPRPRHHRTPPRRDDRGRRGRGKACHDVPRHPVEHRQRRQARAALHQRNPDLELVGVWVHSPDKVGKDAGELAGLAPTGVLATNDVDALLALDADCVSYTATADLRPMDAINDMARILASGKNVVSSSVVSMIYPPHLEPACASRSTTRARRANVSCFTSGIDPGWANDLLAVRAHRHVRVRRRAARHGDRQLQRRTSNRPCCSTRWASARRSTPSRCCCCRACCRSRGAAW